MSQQPGDVEHTITSWRMTFSKDTSEWGESNADPESDCQKPWDHVCVL